MLHSHCFIYSITGDLYLLIPFTYFSPLPVSLATAGLISASVVLFCVSENTRYLSFSVRFVSLSMTHSTLNHVNTSDSFFKNTSLFGCARSCCIMWGPAPWPGTKPGSLAWRAQSSSHWPPGKSQDLFFNGWMIFCFMYTTCSLSVSFDGRRLFPHLTICK